MATVHPPGPDCDDRAHLLPPGVAGNCSSAASAPPNLHWSRMDCEIGANSAYHGANHNICGVCDNSNQAAPWIGFAGAGPGLGAGALGDITAIEPWRQTAAARWPRGPGQRPGDQVQWTAFLTKLCRTCEEVEQANCHFYLNHPAHPHTVGAQPVPHLMNQMVDWPSNQCTCAYHVNGQIGPLAPPGPQRHPIRYCRRDHLDIWQDLTALRNVNDDWLFNSSRDSQGQLCLASRKTKKMRASVKSSSYRACRCGATVDLNGLAPEVLQCMACQGLVHLTLPGTAASRSQPPFRIGEKRANRKYRRAQGNLRLHRHRAAHDDTQ